MKLQLKKDSTSQLVEVFIQDSSSNIGAGLGSLAFNTSGLTAYYYRSGASAAVAISLVTMTLGTWVSGGFVVVNAANMLGTYQLGIPDAALASGADKVTVYLQGATNMAPVLLEIQLTDIDVNDAVRGGMSALPNAIADAAGGLPISDAGGLNLDAKLANTNEITAARMGALTDWINGGRLDLILDTIAADVVNIDGAAMRGTDDAALASVMTSARGAYLDNLNIGESVAGTSEVTSIQNNTKAVRVVPTVLERPDAGSTVYRLELLLYDANGNMEAPDAAPTLDVVDESGTSRTGNLDSTTMTLVSTGRYRSTYTIASTHDLEQLIFTFSVTEGGATRLYGNTSLVVDTTAVDFTAADRAKLDALHDTKIPDVISLANINSEVDAAISDAALATAASLATAQLDLDQITGTDGVTLATLQANYAPAKATDIVTGGAIATTGGAVDSVTLVATTSTNTDMLTAAAVNAEVVDALNVDTYQEPGQGVPPATTSIANKINYLYKFLINRKNQTATLWQLFDNAGTTVDQKATVSSDGTTTEHGKVATGP